MEDPTSQQPVSRSIREEELEKAVIADMVEQPRQLDRLARLILVINFIVPLLCLAGVNFFSGREGQVASNGGTRFMIPALLSWFVAIIANLFVLFSGRIRSNAKTKNDNTGSNPDNIAELYRAGTRFKRRMLLASSIFCFTGIALCVLPLLNLSFPGVSSSEAPPDFVLIRGAEFTMGSPETEEGHNGWNDETQHQVKVSDFYMSKYEVSVAEFRRFIAESGYTTDAEREKWSLIWDGNEVKQVTGVNWRHGVSGKLRPKSEENHPVMHVSWNDAVEYCRWLSAKTGKWYRLPTEAEWEYACRAGSRSPFSTGQNITTAQANYDGNYPYGNTRKGQYRASTVAVNALQPNAWGLYNMHGNVWEWCDDVSSTTYYDECKAKGVVENPCGPVPEKGSPRVLRGGSWFSRARNCRSAFRYNGDPGYRNSLVGFRLVFVPQFTSSH